MGYAATFPKPYPLLVAIVANSIFHLSLHVGAYSIDHYLFEYYVCFASVLPWPLLCLVTKVSITPFPLSLSVEFHTQFPLSWKC